VRKKGHLDCGSAVGVGFADSLSGYLRLCACDLDDLRLVLSSLGMLSGVIQYGLHRGLHMAFVRAMI